MSAEAAPLSRWSYVRAALITLALSSQCVSALPEKSLNAERLARPEAQRNLKLLGSWLRLVGAGSDQASLGARLIAYDQRALAARRVLLSPLRPLLEASGVQQQWGLFLSAHADVSRLRVDVRRSDSGWTLAYLANQADVLGIAPLLSYRRLRGIYHPARQRVRPQYAAFTGWLARRILREHRELAQVRVGLELIHIGTPGVAARVQGTMHVREYARR